MIKKIIIILLSSLLFSEMKPLAIRPFLESPGDYSYSRGTFLIILGNEGGQGLLENGFGLNFLKYKRSQGFTVDVVSTSQISNSGTSLSGDDVRLYMESYYNSNPMLEYVLLVGDINGPLSIPPSYEVQSYNEPGDTDVTDYRYTYFDDENILNPHFFIGRWSPTVNSDIDFLTTRTINYGLQGNVENNVIDPGYSQLYSTNTSHLDNALLISGGYKDDPNEWSWPVTPVWTNLWLMDELSENNYDIDTVFFYAGNQIEGTTEIKEFWSSGTGIINYRGWGDANGWKKPLFFKEHINELQEGWQLPIVMSFVCNTGDFESEACFGEALIKGGNSPISPKGAVAVIAPSDLDTDTRFNNVLCGQIWDEALEGRISELGPLLHAGKQALINEFGRDFEVTGAGGTSNLSEFYHHVYGVLGDPSISMWTGIPKEFQHSIPLSISLPNANSVVVMDENGDALQDVVGAILFGDNLIAKGITDANGEMHLDFVDNEVSSTINPGDVLSLYLNYPQYMQRMIAINYEGIELDVSDDYNFIPNSEAYDEYTFETSIEDPSLYNWIEINQIGKNLCLSDDSVTRIELPFSFNYYGNTYDSLTVSSNGWASFENCDIPYFWNFSIPFAMGPSAMLAPFMDDLDDNAEEPFTDQNENCTWDSGEDYQDRNGDGEWNEGEDLNVYSYFNGNDFIIEWDHIANGENDEYCPNCTYETFQLILNDVYEIIFQYKDVEEIDANGNYSTIGIESPNQDHGIMYQFRNQLFDGLTLVENEMAIKFIPSETMDISNNTSIPQSISLFDAYPNPFNPITTISFSVAELSLLSIAIYDIEGKKVKLLESDLYSPGRHNLQWDGTGNNGSKLPSGLYFVSVRSKEEIMSQKIMLLK